MIRLRLAKRTQQQLEIERNKAQTALATHVNRAMLLERMSDELHQNDASANPIEAVLAHLNNHFGANLCSIHAFFAEPDPALELLAEHKEGKVPDINLSEINPSNPLIQTILVRAAALASDDGGYRSEFIELAEQARLLDQRG